MTLNEAFAVYKANPGDETLDKLYPLVKTRVKNVIRWTLSKYGEPEESLVTTVTHEVLMSLLTYRGESSFSTWVERIARRNSFDEANRIRRSPFQLFAPSEGTFVKELQSTDKADGSALVEQVFSTLGASDKILLAGRMEQWPYEDIAERLGISIPAVKMRWKRLRKKVCYLLSVSRDQRIGSTNGALPKGSGR